MSSQESFEDDERFDGLYLNVAQTTRGIEPLLDTVFSFLRRKTDFFAGPPGADNGPAAAIAKVHQVLDKHAKRYEQEQAQKSARKASIKKPKVAKKVEPKKEEVLEMDLDGGFDVTSTANAAVPQEPVKESSPPAPATNEKKEDSKKDEENETKPPPPGNGATVPGRYVWTQTLQEVNVQIPVPENTRGKNLLVTLARSKIKVGLRSSPGTWIVDAPLCKPIIVDDSFWTVEDGNRLVLNLQKSNTMEWWDCICQDDSVKIDVKSIQPENSKLGDLDGETRKTVEKMMFDQRQKAMGLPTSEEAQKLEALEKFKQAHPELDFSNAKIN